MHNFCMVTYSSSSGFRVVKVSSLSGSVSGKGVVVVVVEVVDVLDAGFKMFLNLDRRLKFLGLDVGGARELVVGLLPLSLLELRRRDLDRNKEVEGFREKDLAVGRGLEVVEGSSSEGSFLQKVLGNGLKLKKLKIFIFNRFFQKM